MLRSLLSPRQAISVGAAALLIEFAAITPWVDELAEDSATAHFTQHGLIFVGGILMGAALRDLFFASRRAR